MPEACAPALVWFKRDLRLADHAPLAAAAQACAPGRPVLALALLEPEWLASPECAPRHVAYWLASVARLRQALRERGLPLLLRQGPAVAVLAELQRRTGFTELLSHEETGPGWSYERDIAVGRWCREAGVHWQEFTQTGVVRRLKSRSGWAARWQRRMDAPAIEAPAHFQGLRHGADGEPVDEGALPTLAELGWTPPQTLPPAGEAAAHDTLRSFLDGRGRGYRRALSSPLTAEQGCSRLSVHLAFGEISLRQVHQATEARIAQAQAVGHAEGDRLLATSLRGFAGRLRWHCHFIQKLEDEPAIEFRNFARVCDGLRPGDEAGGGPPLDAAAQARLAAWCEGRTGYPMVDACMRSLNATGWLNFRMRAMLVSFASYHLWLHWRATGLHLARQFLDFEAGIHWSQMQMQSGTTGINTLRVYSPTKQALDQDPDGHFIRRWVPELARVPLAHLHQPWKMDAATQAAAGCVIGVDYPAPIVDDATAARAAKDAMHGLRKRGEAKAEADAIQNRHGSRKSGLPQTGLGHRGRPPRKPAAARVSEPSPQGELF